MKPDPFLPQNVTHHWVDTAYDAVGNVVRVTDPRNYVTTVEYDAANRKVRTVAPAVPVAGPPLTGSTLDA